MKERCIEILTDRLEQSFFNFVTQPARYVGGEVNQHKTSLSDAELTIALCFPDTYEVGMSNSGMAILYDLLNQQDHLAAERVFAPWIDAEAVMRENKLALFSLESKASLKSFDVVAFSVSCELCYTNVLNMLDLGGLAIRSQDRLEDDPIVVAGGSMANSCEPIAPFVDLFVLGDGEEAALALAELIRTDLKAGCRKKEILVHAARTFSWAYVPGLIDFEYAGEQIVSVTSRDDAVTVHRENAVVQDFENAHVPTRPIVPFVEAVHERVSIEIMRGCPGRCRFCQVSFCKRPIRVRSVERILSLAKQAYEATGFDTVSLLSLSSAEYPHLESLVTELHAYFSEKKVGVSVPSLRVDKQLQLLPKLLTSVRKGGLTLAVEAASERLREIINKPIKDEDLIDAVEAAYRAGWQRLKLYFMVGLPGETEEDIRKIVDLCRELAKRGIAILGHKAQINAAVNWFVPKSHTPFAWMSQQSRDYFEQARRIIYDRKDELRARFLQFKFHTPDSSLLESAMGRGDRRLAAVIETAWRSGARFDLWSECFDYGLWQKAFEAHEMDLEFQAKRTYNPSDLNAWEHLGGPKKTYLRDHHNQAMDLL